MDGAEYQIRLVDPIEDPENDHIDVEIKFPDGRRYVPTFFTVKNIQHLMETYASTGESLNGTYLWAVDMIIVKELTPEVIRETIADLVERDRLSWVSKDYGPLDLDEE